MQTMRVMDKGVVTIPKEVREVTGIRVGDQVEFTVHGSVIELRRPSRLDKVVGILDHLPKGYTDAVVADMRGKDCIPVRKKKS